MDPELEARYLEWLHSKVVLEFADGSPKSYYELFSIMNKTQFVWLIPGDDNRAEYGTMLRTAFLNETRQRRYSEWENEPCSVLEMLIAFADLAEFETDIPTSDWFWIFMRTLGLADMSDDEGVEPGIVSDILNRFIWRTYDYDGGKGGLFPLNHATEDQRRVEIWYQFSAYVIERQLV